MGNFLHFFESSGRFTVMKPLCVAMSLLGLIFTISAADSPLRVMVVTGGHAFDAKPFFRMFEDDRGIVFTNIVQAKSSSTAYDRDDLLSYHCVVLYDMVQTITDHQKARLTAALDKGIGFVVLHHALVSYQSWPEFEKIVGGTYPEPQDKKGAVTPDLGYQHDVDLPVVIMAKNHPITAGLTDFMLNDEIYWGFRVSPDVTPLVTTTQAKSGKPLGWCHTYRNSRVVYFQSGHGPSAHDNPNYRKLVSQSIRWTARNGGN